MAFWNRKKYSELTLNDLRESVNKPKFQEKMNKMASDPAFQDGLQKRTENRIALYKAQRPDDDDYGYSPTNPICTSSINYSEKYLARLLTDKGEKLLWIRWGSFALKECNGVSNVVVDKYDLFLHGEKYAEIYLCPYGHSGEYVPKNMTLAEEGDLSQGDGNLKAEAYNAGMTVEQYLQFKRLEYENKMIIRQEEEKKAAQMESEFLEVRRIYPNFDSEQSMKNETFASLVGCGVSVKKAYEYIHRDTMFFPFEAEDYYEVMSDFEKEKREPLVSPSDGPAFEKWAYSIGMTVPQAEAYYDLANMEWEKLQGKMRIWADQAVSLQKKYPEFCIWDAYPEEEFRRVLEATDMLTAYEILHFDELYYRICK